MAEARDGRIDKAVTWVLTTAAALALAWAGNAFAGLQGEVHSMRDDIAKQNTRIAVIEEARRLESLEVERRFVSIEHRVEQLEGKK